MDIPIHIHARRFLRRVFAFLGLLLDSFGWAKLIYFPQDTREKNERGQDRSCV